MSRAETRKLELLLKKKINKNNMYDMDVSDCIDNISQEACKSHSQSRFTCVWYFLLSISIVSLEDKRNTKNTA